MHTRSTLIARLDDLLTVAARVSSVSDADVKALGHAVLGLSASASQTNGRANANSHANGNGNGNAMAGGRSTLNNDGYPLQVCLSASADGIGVRLVADPAWSLGEPRARVDASRAILDAQVARAAPALATACSSLVAQVISATQDETRFHHGLLWLGVSPDRPGIACYCDAAPLGAASFDTAAFNAAAFDAAASWLATLLPDMTDATRILARLREPECATLASLGIEGLDPRTGRAKIYWRFRQATRLDTLGIAPLMDAGIATFLARAIGSREMRFSGAVFSVGFDLATGRVADAKIDLCAHCLPSTAADWMSCLDTLCDDFALPRFPIRRELLSGECETAFISLGVDTRAKRRLNLYLKPPSARFADRTRDLDRAIASAADYLCDLQRPDGAWVDYRLPVGESTQWVTAFVGLALARCAPRLNGGGARAATAATNGARWLDESRSYEAGWGFNHTTGADADSTAFALRLFHAVQRPVRAADEEWLLERWKPEGGFATYDDRSQWGAVHPCVTATGFLALAPAQQQRLRASLDRYLDRTRRGDGTWPSYWWRHHYYSTFHHMRLQRALGHTGHSNHTSNEALDLPDGSSAFDLAYAAGIAELGGAPPAVARALLDRLLDTQKADGGWEGGFNLRVTDPECAEPWNDPRGALYCDYRASITTASALMVLTEMRHA